MGQSMQGTKSRTTPRVREIHALLKVVRTQETIESTQYSNGQEHKSKALQRKQIFINYKMISH